MLNSFEGSDNPGATEPQVVESKELFQGKREIVILHNQDRYRLLITKANKLILNK